VTCADASADKTPDGCHYQDQCEEERPSWRGHGETVSLHPLVAAFIAPADAALRHNCGVLHVAPEYAFPSGWKAISPLFGLQVSARLMKRVAQVWTPFAQEHDRDAAAPNEQVCGLARSIFPGTREPRSVAEYASGQEHGHGCCDRQASKKADSVRSGACKFVGLDPGGHGCWISVSDRSSLSMGYCTSSCTPRAGKRLMRSGWAAR
jgi:hypothetical protein